MSSQIDKQAIVNLLKEKISPKQVIYPNRIRVQNTKSWKRIKRSIESGNRITRIFTCEYHPLMNPLKAIVIHERSTSGQEIIASIKVTYANGIEIANSPSPVKKKRKRSIKKIKAGLDRFNFEDE